jgi:hypothetical protein
MGLCDIFKSVSDNHSCLALTLSAVGAAVLVGFGLSFVQFVLQAFVLSGHSVGNYLAPASNSFLTLNVQLKKYGAKNGAWAGKFPT